MPHRRKARKGSFGSHFDELVTQFDGHQAPRQDDTSDASEKSRSVNDRLLERAWRGSTRGQPSRFSNQ
jgi:hypothetical protein